MMLCASANSDTVVSRKPRRTVYDDTEQHTPQLGTCTGSIHDMLPSRTPQLAWRRLIRRCSAVFCFVLPFMRINLIPRHRCRVSASCLSPGSSSSVWAQRHAVRGRRHGRRRWGRRRVEPALTDTPSSARPVPGGSTAAYRRCGSRRRLRSVRELERRSPAARRPQVDVHVGVLAQAAAVAVGVGGSGAPVWRLRRLCVRPAAAAAAVDLWRRAPLPRRTPVSAAAAAAAMWGPRAARR